MKKFLRNNGLSIVLIVIFLACISGQAFTGFIEHNKELKEKGQPQISFGPYLQSGHFFQSTFENWESEFFQMAMYVVLSASLFQKGSSESNDPDAPKENESAAAAAAIHPILKKGKLLRFLYSYSLSITFFLLFIISFFLHWYGSLRDYNLMQSLNNEPTVSFWAYLGNNRLWFESFQNWQSEFLSVFTVVVFTIFMRHKGSPQSKKLSDPDSKTG